MERVTLPGTEGAVADTLNNLVAKYGRAFTNSKIYESGIKDWVEGPLSSKLESNLSGGSLTPRTGNLKNNTFPRGPTEIRDGFLVEIVSTAPYARIQNQGGTINARTGGFLAIPLPAARDGSGTALFSFREAFSQGNTFIQTSRSGNRLLFRSTGAGNIIPLFVLKQQVTIQGTGYADDAIDSTIEEIPEFLQSRVFAALKEVENEN